MLGNLARFARGLFLGIVIGGAVGLLFAPGPGEETQATLQERVEAARRAFEEARTRTEQELTEYFEKAKRGTEPG